MITLGQVPLRSWKPARRQMSRAPRMGQREWTPTEAEAWLKQVTPALRIYPDCGNGFTQRARQIVDGLEAGSVQYDDLIPITPEEWALKSRIDECLAEQKAAAKTRDERTEMVMVIGGLAVGLGVVYFLIA